MKTDYQILKRYLDSKDPGKDKLIVLSWFLNLQAEKELRNKSWRYWDELPEEIMPENYNESEVLGSIYRKIKLREGQIRPVTSKPKRILNIVSKIAAILFIPLLTHAVIVNFSQNTFSEKITYTEIYSPMGARTIFYLPDGSSGFLKGGSYLKFPERFVGKNREVSLKGEAYFDVVTNPKKPFVVAGKSLEIVAKGTIFNISAWDDVAETEVVLVDGKLEVFLESKDEKKRIATLNPGQLLHYVPHETGSYIQNADVRKYISWTEGKLVFKEDSFADVVKEINRWYNVNIIIKDDILKNYKYVATFEDETLDEILKMLTYSAPIRYKEFKRTKTADGTYEKRTIELYYKPLKK